MGLALTAVMGQAAEPTIDYSLELKLTFTGVLYQSTDGVNWTVVEGATSPYYVPVEDARKMFFCSKDPEHPEPPAAGQNAAIPLAETVDLDLNWIAPGTFVMGSSKDELGRGDNETQHQVTLTQGYWMGRYEITQAQYKAVTGRNPSVFKDDSNPVENVSWFDARDFCAKLTEIEAAAGRLPEGYEYALPTEAQWEYACRAGTITAFNNGTNIPAAEQIEDEYCFNLNAIGWYKFNSYGTTAPAGEKQPNAWGLYDMHGNVAEWCSDWYKKDYPNPFAVDPAGPYTAIRRVVRGGSYSDGAGSCRSAFRLASLMTYSDSTVGFRVALVPVSLNKTIPLSDDVGLEMIRIEPGTFIMGSPEDELGYDNHFPETQHEVTLAEEYWLGRYEVTQAQYETLMGTNPSRFKGADLPVEMVSRDDAMAFCAKLTEIEKAAGRLPAGYEYTLPTEAQWEYACRAGTTTAFNNGTNIEAEEQIYGECPNLDEVGWYMFNSGGTFDSDGSYNFDGKTF
ncbi:MAG: formylglycine-generating enzyme family protein, partial [Verrucomicrobia bacterium]|nr:formylglycine-generating enzyme family protein [Verrucomicrobiota bacterium]